MSELQKLLHEIEQVAFEQGLTEIRALVIRALDIVDPTGAWPHQPA